MTVGQRWSLKYPLMYRSHPILLSLLKILDHRSLINYSRMNQAFRETSPAWASLYKNESPKRSSRTFVRHSSATPVGNWYHLVMKLRASTMRYPRHVIIHHLIWEYQQTANHVV